MGYTGIASNYNDTDLTPSNIKNGVDVFGVVGNFSGGNAGYGTTNIAGVMGPMVGWFGGGYGKNPAVMLSAIHNAYETASDIYICGLILGQIPNNSSIFEEIPGTQQAFIAKIPKNGGDIIYYKSAQVSASFYDYEEGTSVGPGSPHMGISGGNIYFYTQTDGRNQYKYFYFDVATDSFVYDGSTTTGTTREINLDGDVNQIYSSNHNTNGERGPAFTTQPPSLTAMSASITYNGYIYSCKSYKVADENDYGIVGGQFFLIKESV